MNIAIRIVVVLVIAGSIMNFDKEMSFAQEYQLPPQEVIDIIDAAPEPAVSFSPDSKWMMLIERDAMPDITDVSRRMLQLGGLRIDPVANSRFQTSFSKGLLLRKTGLKNSG